MGFLTGLVSHIFREKHSTSVVITLPTKLLMATDTLVYLRNEGCNDGGEVDRDFIVGLALAQYVQHHLYDKNATKIKSVPPSPLKPPEYTNGRRQAKAVGYTDYQTYQRQQTLE